MKKNKTLRFWFMAACLILAGVGIHWIEIGGEAKVTRKSLSQFPSQFGVWKQVGTDQRFDRQSETVLGADEYVTRDYSMPDGKTANLYIGYYRTQKTGATYHSPQHCLPGSGWMLNEPKKIKIKTHGKEFEANLFVIENAGNKAILIYWYQGRGRAVSNEYWDKLYTIFDSVTRRRSDGAMVRIVMGFGQSENSENEAIKVASDLAVHVAPELPVFVPN